MPCHVDWYLEGRIIHQHYVGVVVPDEITQLQAENRVLLKAGEPPIHLLVDLLDVKRFPLSVSQIGNAFEVDLEYGKLIGTVVIITKNPVTRFLATVLTQVSRLQFEVVEDLTTAIEYLNGHDPTLATADDL